MEETKAQDGNLPWSHGWFEMKLGFPRTVSLQGFFILLLIFCHSEGPCNHSDTLLQVGKDRLFPTLAQTHVWSQAGWMLVLGEGHVGYRVCEMKTVIAVSQGGRHSHVGDLLVKCEML
jgi:hypothetical protein